MRCMAQCFGSRMWACMHLHALIGLHGTIVCDLPGHLSDQAAQARLLHPGHGHVVAACQGMELATTLLCCAALQRSLGEEGRLRALRHVCAALPRTAQALPEQVRQLSSSVRLTGALPTPSHGYTACSAPCAQRSGLTAGAPWGPGLDLIGLLRVGDAVSKCHVFCRQPVLL